jgi:hypothetical protein
MTERSEAIQQTQRARSFVGSAAASWEASR